jgi:hypothetical protein
MKFRGVILFAVAIGLLQFPVQGRQTKPAQAAQAAPEPIMAIKAGKLLNPETGKAEAN